MPSITAHLLRAYLRVTRANRTYVSADAARRRVEMRRIRPKRYAPPRLRGDVAVTVERRDGWPVYTLSPRYPVGTVIYAHGGGWVGEIALQHWQLCAQLAAEAGVRVIVPIYPLVPFGTAAQVVPRVAELARAHSPVVLAGDSAGGQIALSAAQLVGDAEVVRRSILISPALDLAFSNPSIPAVQPRDPWLGRPGGLVFATSWAGSLPIDDPLGSPLFGDFTGLGPITLFTGTDDILNPDARLMIDRARAAGVEVDEHEGVGLVHVYPLTPTREGRAARAVIVDTVRAAF